MASTPHLRKPDDEHRRLAWGSVEENELRIDRTDADRLVEALNTDLSGLFILYNQVRKHYWTVEGAESSQVGDFLEDAADRLADATDDLAIRVHALGGVPVSGPMGVREHAPMHIEAADVYNVRPSLSNDLDGYATLAVNLREHIRVAESVGDEATNELLREHLRLLEEDAHAIANYLEDDTLLTREALR